ncbi:MAG TPA: ATP-binding protein [Burkholderiales bacterium]|jgi:two-component system, OmpR family, sensor histidine kinase BaeS|nr:ATP-binding protein [Burkholderiales bacterium]
MNTSATPSPPRFDRLRIKLFLIIAGVNAVLAITAYLFFSWSFDRGVAESLKQADVARLDSMIATLVVGYEREGGWAWIVKDKDRWDDMSRSALGLPPRAPEEVDAKPGTPPLEPPVREYPLTLNRRLLLFDAERKLLIGRAERVVEAELKAIESKGRVVGYVGYIPRLQFVESVGRVYSDRQDSRFAALAAGMLATALLLGAGLAHWLTERVRAVARGTAALIQGDYDIRLGAKGQDELAQLARDFNKLAETLKATREARSQWIADIAHELRTPLAILRGEIEALQDGVRPLNPTTLGSLAQEVNRLSRLVEDLHLLSTADRGALTYAFEPQDLRELIEESVEQHATPLRERGLRLRLNLTSETSVQGDAVRLRQVFDNLMQNSLRYTDAPGELQVDMKRDGEDVVVDWQDSSPGVSANDMPKLTDRLFRVEASRNRDSGGAGLGLAIARAIVLAHHGSMSAQSSKLGGLWWQLRFPSYRGLHG